jgi:hypothetical protein
MERAKVSNPSRLHQEQHNPACLIATMRCSASREVAISVARSGRQGWYSERPNRQSVRRTERRLAVANWIPAVFVAASGCGAVGRWEVEALSARPRHWVGTKCQVAPASSLRKSAPAVSMASVRPVCSTTAAVGSLLGNVGSSFLRASAGPPLPCWTMLATSIPSMCASKQIAEELLKAGLEWIFLPFGTTFNPHTTKDKRSGLRARRPSS